MNRNLSNSPPRWRPLTWLGAAVCVAGWLTGCQGSPARVMKRPPTSRGVILISLDTLGADHLGAYGYARKTSPFFDKLADRGVLFEQAIAQYPSTLVSHVSMFTGLYPREHGVYPPTRSPSPELEMLPERFRTFGFRTAGHTEGGFVSRHYGFDRGFDEFSDPRVEKDTDIEATFDKGIDFLRGLGDNDRFFLFLHSYSAHDPYEPPPAFEALFWQHPPPTRLESSGTNIRDINRGLLEIDTATALYFEALYDAGVRYIDSVLEQLVEELDRLGLLAETTLVITSDHGEEFLEHGRLGHSQVYPENLRVPLLVLHPGLAPRRVPDLVELIDIPPTLYELAGLTAPGGLSGESLVPHLLGRRHARSSAYAEVADGPPQKALWQRNQETTFELVVTEPDSEPDGTWVTRRVGFEVEVPKFEFSIASYPAPRKVRLLLEGSDFAEFVSQTHWSTRQFDLPPGRQRYRLDIVTDGCTSPRDLGEGDDPRCLSLKLRGLDLELGELFDLVDDPQAQRDIGSLRPDLYAALRARLAGLTWPSRASPQESSLTDDTRNTLRALGYID